MTEKELVDEIYEICEMEELTDTEILGRINKLLEDNPT